MPRRGADLPSLGGSRISTGSLWCRSCRAAACVRVRSVRRRGGRRDRCAPGIAGSRPSSRSRPTFPPEVEAAAAAAAAAPRLPDLDRTDLPLVTIDPPGSMDLDQALHLERDGDGYVVRYAIADVAAFVDAGRPGRRRGATGAARRCTARTRKVPLHPKVLSEGAASLLPDQVRPALLWTIRLDADGARHRRRRGAGAGALAGAADLRRGAAAIDDGTASESLMLLREVGELRLGREAARGGISLPLPEQEVDVEGDAVAPRVPRRSSRSSAGTRRSRCSPASPPPR